MLRRKRYFGRFESTPKKTLPKKDQARRKMLFETMERRILLSADPVLSSIAIEEGQNLLIDAMPVIVEYDMQVTHSGDTSSSDASCMDDTAVAGSAEILQTDSSGESDGISGKNDGAESSAREIVFIDSSVRDHESILDSIVNKEDGTEASDYIIVTLDSEQDGIQQITDTLSQYTDVSAVHIISHGAEGTLRLGDTVIGQDSLDDYSSSLGEWKSHMTGDGDILLYGCNVANGESGIFFVQELSDITGSDVAASTDDTGSAELGGDWKLEYSTGIIETSPVLDGTAEDYDHLLADLYVNADASVSGEYDLVVVDGTWTLTVDGDLTILDGIVGDDDGSADSLSIISNGTVTVNGVTGSNDELLNLTISAPTIIIEGATIDVEGTFYLIADASNETTWADFVPFYDDDIAATEINIISSHITAGQDIVIKADSSNVRQSDLEIDFAALSSMTAMSTEFDPAITFVNNGDTDQIVRDIGSWIEDGFAVGQQISVSGSTVNAGVYTVTDVTDTVLTLGASDSLADETDVYDLTIVERKAAFVEQATTQLDFNGNTITRSVGGWADDGFVDGMTIYISGTDLNDGSYTIDDNGVNGSVLTITGTFNNEDDATGVHIEAETIVMDDEGGSVTIDFVHSEIDPDTLTRSSGSWIADGFKEGQKILIAGFTKDGKVIEATIDTMNAATLTLTTEDSVLESRQAVSGISVTGAGAVFTEPAVTQITFADNDDLADTITRDAGSWIDDGFVAGMMVTVSGTVDSNDDGAPDNDGVFEIASVTANTLTLIEDEELTNQVATGISIVQSYKMTDAELSQWSTLTLDGSTVTRDTGSWIEDGFLAGQTVTLSGSVDGNNDGDYNVTLVTEKVLYLSDVFTQEESTDINIQETDESVNSMTAYSPVLTLSAAAGTLTRDEGLWSDDGFVAGMTILIGGSSQGNDGKYVIESISADGYTLYLSGGPDTLANETSADITVAEDYEEGQAVLEACTPRLTFADVGTTDTITRESGSWVDDGFEIGQTIEVTGSENNDGDYTIQDITGGGAVLVLSSDSALSNETASDVTVTSTEGGTLANAMPLISFADIGDADTISRAYGSWKDDGFIAGKTIIVSGSSANDGTYVIGSISSDGLTITLSSDAELQAEITTDVSIASDPQDKAELEDMTPVLDFVNNGSADQIVRSLGSWVDDGFEVGRQILVDGSTDNDGAYTISSVTATTLILSANDLLTDETGSEGVSVGEIQAYFQHTSPGLTFADNASGYDTITRETGSWIEEGFKVGMEIDVSGTTGNDNYYTITEVTDLVLTLSDGDSLVNEGKANLSKSAPDLTFADNGSADMITRSAGSWIEDGFQAGDLILVSGTEFNDNDDEDIEDYYTIAEVTDTTLTLSSGDSLTSETGGDIEVIGAYGIVMSGMLPTLTFSDDGSADTITREKGSWWEDGFKAGQEIFVKGSTGNDGTYTITTISDDGLTLTLSSGDSLSGETGNNIEVISTAGVRGVQVTEVTSYGELNSVHETLIFEDSSRTIERTIGSWTTDGFAEGGWITVTGTGSNNGTYEIESVSVDGKTLTLVSGTVLAGEAISENFTVVSTLASMSGSPNVTFSDAGGSDRDYISRSSGSWIDDGFEAGMTVTISGSGSNNGAYLIDEVTADTIYLDEDETLALEEDVANVSVYVELSAANVPLVARDSGGNVVWNFFAGESETLLEGTADFVGVTEYLFKLMGAMPADVVRASATSIINIYGTVTEGTTLDALAGGVDISAIAASEVESKSVSLFLGVSVGISNASASAVIGDYTTITASEDFALSADVTNGLEVIANASSGKKAYASKLFAFTKEVPISGPSIAVGVGVANSTSVSTVADSAVISAGSISVGANNINNFSTETSSKSIDPTKAFGEAIGFTFAEYDSDATATLGGTVMEGSGDVSITAHSINEANLTISNALVNSQNENLELLDSIKEKLGDFAGLFKAKSENKAEEETGQEASKQYGSFSMAGAVSIAFSENSATANIASDATVNSTGNIKVDSLARDNARIQSASEVSLYSKNSFGGAVAVADYGNNAHAFVGEGATVTLAGNLDIIALSENPAISDIETYLAENWDNYKQKFEAIVDFPEDTEAVEFLEEFMDKGWEVISAKEILSSGILSTNVGAISSASPENDKEDNKSKLAVSGSVNVFTYTNTSEAYIDEGVHVTFNGSDGNLNVDSEAVLESINLGGVSVDDITEIIKGSPTAESGGTSAGGTFNGIFQENSSNAYIADGVVITGVNNVDVSSNAENRVITVTYSGSKGKYGLNGSVAVNDIDNTSNAYIEDRAQIDASGYVSIDAKSEFFGVNVAGAISKGDKLAFGVAVAVNDVDNTTMAFIGDETTSATYTDDGHITSGGDITVDASSSENLWNFTIAGSSAKGEKKTTPGWQPPAGGIPLPGLARAPEKEKTEESAGIGISGAVSINLLDDHTYAYIKGVSLVDATGDVDISAENSALAVAGTGGITLTTSSPKGGGFAGSFAYNDLYRATEAYTQDVIITAASLSVTALVDDMIIAGTVGASGAKTSGKNVNVTGAANVNLIENNTLAAVGDNSNVTVSGNVSVNGTTITQLISVAGAVTVSGKAGAGAGVDFTKVDNETDAYIGANAEIDAGGNVTIIADSEEFIVSVAICGSVGGKGLGLSGAVGIQILDAYIDAYINGSATVIADGSVLVDANDDNFIVAVAGQAAIGKKVGIGASVVVTTMTRELNSYIGDGAQITAYGEGTAVDDPQEVWTGKRGVAVEAIAEDDLYLIAAGGSGGGNLAFAASVVTNVITSDTKAYIDDNAVINTQDVSGLESGSAYVNAEHDANFVIIGGSASGSKKMGIGAAADVLVFDRDVEAYIGSGAVVTADGDVMVNADLDETVWAVAAGVGGSGKVMVNGSAVVLVMTGSTLASIEDNSMATAEGKVNVTANSHADLNTIAGTAGFGGKAGFGISASVIVHTDTVTASIGDGAVITAPGTDGLVVSADSSEDLLTIAAGASGGGKAGITGSAVVNVLTETTRSYIEDNTGTGDIHAQDVIVSAKDVSDFISVAGSAGLGGSAGIGAGADVGVITKNTSAYIGDSVLINAENDIFITAEGSEDIISVSGNIGAGGKAGIAGSAGVYVDVTKTEAYIDDNATVEANGDVVVSADATFDIIGIAGQLSGGGKAGIGASAVVLVHTDTVDAHIGSGASVTSLGLGDPSQIQADGRTGTAGVNLSTETPVLTFSGTTITRSGGSWTDEGFVAGQIIEVSDTAGNDGQYMISSISEDGLTLTLASLVGLSGEVAAGAQVESAGASMAESVPALVFTDSGDADTITRTTGSWVDDGFSEGQTIIVTNAGENSGRYVIASVTENTLILTEDAPLTDGVAANAGVIGKATDAWDTEYAHGLTVSATSSEDILAVAAGLSGGGTAGLAGSAVVDVLDENTAAYIGNGAVINGTNTGAGGEQGVHLLAADNTSIIAVAGSVGLGGTAGIGAGADVEVINKDTSAWIDGDVTVEDDVSVKAKSSEDITSVAANLGIGGSAGISGAAGVYIITTNTNATITGASAVTAGGDVMVAAQGDFDITDVAGQISAGGSAGVGISALVLIHTDTVKASIGSGAQITVLGAGDGVSAFTGQLDNNGNWMEETADGLIVTAVSSEDITGIAAGGAGAGAAGIAGSAAVNVMVEKTRAEIGSGAQINYEETGMDQDQRIMVAAADHTSIFSLAGALAGGGAAGIGAGVDIGVISKDTQAVTGSNATVNAGQDVIIQALGSEDITSISASAGIGGSAGIAGSVGVYTMSLTTRSYIGSGAKVKADGSVVISAVDGTEINLIAGNISAGGAAGIGVGAGVVVVDKTTEAFISQNAEVDARANREGIDVLTGSFDIGSEPVPALTGSPALTFIDNGGSGDTIYRSSGSWITDGFEAGQTITISGTEDNDGTYLIDSVSGNTITLVASSDPDDNSLTFEANVTGVDIAMLIGADGEIGAAGGGAMDLDGDGGTDIAGDAFSMQRTADAETITGFKGVAVTAVNQDTINTIVASVGLAGAVAVNVSGAVNVISSDTLAYIDDGARINATNDADEGDAQSVLVSSGNDFEHLGVVVAAAGAGAVAVTPGVDVVVFEGNTRAFIDDGTRTEAEQDVWVTAHASEDVLSVAAGAAISGTVAVGGAVGVIVMDNTTLAYIGDSDGTDTLGATVVAGGNILVSSSDDTEIMVVAGSLGIGIGAAGLGAAVDVTVIDKDTRAFIGDFSEIQAGGDSLGLTGVFDGNISLGDFTKEEAFLGIAVQASSTEDIFVIAATAAGGIGAGLAGGVTVECIDSDTTAYIGADSSVNTDQSVSVSAVNKAEVFAFAGGIAGGLVGIAGGVDIGTIRNDTWSYIGNGAEVNATHDIDVNALSIKDVETYAVSGAGGAVALAGSVSVWSIGSPITSSYSYEETNIDDDTKTTQSEDSLDDDGFSDTTDGVDEMTGKFSDILGGYNDPDMNDRARKSIDNANADVSGIDQGSDAQTRIADTSESGTTGYIGEGAVVEADDDISIRAEEDIKFDSLTGSASVGVVGIGGSVTITNVNSKTTAYIGNSATVSAGPDEGDDILVYAGLTDNVEGEAYAGQAGLVALGAQVTVINDSSVQSAYVDDGAAIEQAGGMVTVKAEADRDVSAYAKGGNISGTVSAGAAVAITDLGGETVAYIGDVDIGQTSGMSVGGVGVLAVADSTAEADTLAVSAGLFAGLSGSIALATVDPTIEASIRDGAAIEVLNDIIVQSFSIADVEAEALGVNAAGGAALGVSVAIATDNPAISSLIGASILTALNGNVELWALHNYSPTGAFIVGKGADAEATCGSGALVLGAAGAYAESENDVSVTNRISSGAAVTAGDDVILASCVYNQSGGDTMGIGGGIIGVGVSLSYATISGTIDTYIGNAEIIAGNNVEVASNTYNYAMTESLAVSGGILSGSGNVSESEISPVVLAGIWSGSGITAGQDVIVTSNAINSAYSDTEGVSAGVLAVGVSESNATIASVISAYAGGDITAGSLTVYASHRLPYIGDSASAKATGSSGALIGVNATSSNAVSNVNVNSFVSDDSNLIITGDTIIVADNISRQVAEADSNVGGIIAAGISSSSVSSYSITNAYLGSGATLTGASLTIAATGHEDNYSDTVAGSGGAIAGASATADTLNLSSTNAEVKDGASIDLTQTDNGAFSLKADHTAEFNSKVKTFAGGLLAGSGADIDNNVVSNVKASVGDNTEVNALDIDIEAVNHALKQPLYESNIDGTTGGFISGGGADSTTTIDFVTLVNVGDNASLTVSGDLTDPGSFILRALNELVVKDKVALGSGGLVSGLGAYSTIETINDLAKVLIGSGANLSTVGEIDISARGEGDVSAVVEAEAYGVGTFIAADSVVDLNPENVVEISGEGTVIHARGDLNISAGRRIDFVRDQYTVVALTDTFAGSAIPLDDVDASSILVQDNTITVASGALLETGGDMNLHAENKGYAHMTGKAKATSWVSGLLDFLNGSAAAEMYNGTIHSEAHGTVHVDGTLRTGLYRNQSLVLTDWDPETGEVTGTATDGITFRSSIELLKSGLGAELDYAKEQLAIYRGTNDLLLDFYEKEVERIEAEMQELGLLEINTSSTGEEVASVIVQYVMTVTVDPIVAQAGVIDVRADQLEGTGIFDAPGDGGVIIENNTPAYLVIEGIIIPQTNGGLFLNGIEISDNEEIYEQNQLNAADDNIRNLDEGPETPAIPYFSSITISETEDEPLIRISNTLDVRLYDDDSEENYTRYTWPDIAIAGDVENIRGTLEIDNSVGSGNIDITAKVNAKNMSVISGGTVFIEDLITYSVGGDVYSQLSMAGENGTAAATDTYVIDMLTEPSDHIDLYGDKIFISAEYININGVIQSGKEDYTLVIGNETETEIEGISSGMTGLVKLVTASTSDFDVYFDTATRQIIVQEISVSGGHIELEGNIMSTGAGNITVLGGYGDINITNNTAYDIVINRLDASKSGAGILLIKDKARDAEEGSIYATLYEQTKDGVIVTTDDGSGPVETPGSDSMTYEPETGWRYGWSVGKETFERWNAIISSSSWAGIDDLAADPDNIYWGESENITEPHLIDDSAYFYYEPDPDPDDDEGIDKNTYYQFQDDEYAMTTAVTYEKSHWTTTSWCGVKTYYSHYVKEQKWQYIYTHNVEADIPISINFIGQDEANISITSTNADADIIIEGAILNTTGSTTITSAGSIKQSGDSGYVGGVEVVLTAETGIGDSANALQTNLFDESASDDTTVNPSLTAVTTDGVIYIEEIIGDLYIDQVKTGLEQYVSEDDPTDVEITGDQVSIRAHGDILAAQKPDGTYYEGLVQGGIVELTSETGGIGAEGRSIVLDSGTLSKDYVSGSADGDIFLEEKEGDLRLNNVSTSGDVYIEVKTGDLIDANSEEVRDERTYEELKTGVWADLRLTESTGVLEKIQDALDSFAANKEQEYRTYWTYRSTQSDPSVYDEDFQVTLSDGERNYYEDYYAGQDMTEEEIEDAITTLENKRTTEYHTLHDSYGGYGDTYNPDFTYTLTSEEDQAIRESIPIWTEEQLLYAMSSGILMAVTDTETRIENPNISGGNVTVISSGGIGEAIEQTVIDVTIDDYEITDDQRVALAAAERDDITYWGSGITITVDIDAGDSGDTITRSDGGSWIDDGFTAGAKIRIQESSAAISDEGEIYLIGSVTDSVITLSQDSDLANETGRTVRITPEVTDPGEEGVTVTAITIDQREDIDIETEGGINIQAGGSVYLGSEVDLNIDHIISGSKVIIKGGGGIYNVTFSGVNITGQDLVLEAADGPVGSDEKPIYTDVSGDSTISARASDDIHIVETDGNMNVGTMYSQTGGVYLEALNGSIVDGINSEFSNISANEIALNAVNGGIGEDGDYLDMDVSQTGTLTAKAETGIFIAETFQDMNIDTVISCTGDVDLKAHQSIVDAVDDSSGLDSRPDVDVYGNNITLTAQYGTIGMSGNDLDIMSGYYYSPGADGQYGTSDDTTVETGTGSLTSSSYGNTYIIQTNGDLGINRIATLSTGATAFIASMTGGVFNRNEDEGNPYNVTSGKVYFFASDDIGQEDNKITTQAGNIEGQSTSGKAWISNEGALTVGGVTEGSDGFSSAGGLNIEASSPIIVAESMTSTYVYLIANDDGNDYGEGDDGYPDNITINEGVTLTATQGDVLISAGDNIYLLGNVVSSGDIYISVDYNSMDDQGETLEIPGSMTGNSLYIQGGVHGDSFLLSDVNFEGISGRITISGYGGNDVFELAVSSEDAFLFSVHGGEDYDLLDIVISGGTEGLVSVLTMDSITIEPDGIINYYEVEALDIGLGSGNDTFAIKGVAAETALNTGAGDDTINIGNDDSMLDNILAILNINAGSGSNTLNIDNSGDTDDNLDLVMGDHVISGFGPADINFTAAGGDFYEGININTGSGNDYITVRNTPMNAVTNLYTESGNDTILISLMAGSDGTFNINPGDGDDTVNASLFSSGISGLPDSTMPLIIMGMAGSDHLTGGSGNDVLIGDNGIVMYKGGELWKIVTIKSNDGDADYLDGGEGMDVLLGGEGHDTIMGESSADILIANYGKVVFKNGKVVSIFPSLDMIPGSVLYKSEKGIPVIEGAGPVRFGDASYKEPSPFGEQREWGFDQTAHHSSYIQSGSGFQVMPGEPTEEGIQATDSDRTRVFTAEDGSTIIQRSNGAFVLITPEGVKNILSDRVVILQDGTCIVTFTDGTIVTIMPDGRVTTSLNEGATEDSGEVEEGEESIEINPDISFMEGLKNLSGSDNKQGAIELGSLVAGLSGWGLAGSSTLSSDNSSIDREGFRRLEKGSKMRRFLRWSKGRFVKNGSEIYGEVERKKMH